MSLESFNYPCTPLLFSNRLVIESWHGQLFKRKEDHIRPAVIVSRTFVIVPRSVHPDAAKYWPSIPASNIFVISRPCAFEVIYSKQHPLFLFLCEETLIRDSRVVNPHGETIEIKTEATRTCLRSPRPEARAHSFFLDLKMMYQLSTFVAELTIVSMTCLPMCGFAQHLAQMLNTECGIGIV